MSHSARDVLEDNGPAGVCDILSPVQLPSGRSLKNRLVKVALYEHFATLFGGPPNAAHYELYQRWSEGDWGMVITGNVQVERDHLSLGRDMIVPGVLISEGIAPFKKLASVIHGEGFRSLDPSSEHRRRPMAILQLSHSGRQSANVLGGRWPFVRPLAPSPLPLGRSPTSRLGPRSSLSVLFSDFIHALAFQVPRAMSTRHIDGTIEAFVRGAQLAARSGFDGVELHAAHGYLIAQFISPKSNNRTDEYSVTDHPLRFLHRIVTGIRSCDDMPQDFILGVKLNASDYVSRLQDDKLSAQGEPPTADEERALSHVNEIASWRMVDFIEVSGGDYENADFLSTRSSQRQALFANFSRRAVQVLSADAPSANSQHRSDVGTHGEDTSKIFSRCSPLVLLTGGFRSVPLLASALRQQHAHLLGAGRLSILCPDLPLRLRQALSNPEDDLAQAILTESFPEPNLVLGRSPLHGSWGRTLRYKLESTLVSAVLALWALLPVELPKLVGAGTNMAWYVVMMRRIAAGQEVDYSVSGVGAVIRMWLWVAPTSDGESWIQRIWDSWIVMGLIGVIIGFVLGSYLQI